MEWVFEKVKSTIYYLGWTAGIIAIAIIVLLYLFQNNLIYMPSKSLN